VASARESKLANLIRKSSEQLLLPWTTRIFRPSVSNSRRSFDNPRPQWTGCAGHYEAKEIVAVCSPSPKLQPLVVSTRAACRQNKTPTWYLVGDISMGRNGQCQDADPRHGCCRYRLQHAAAPSDNTLSLVQYPRVRSRRDCADSVRNAKLPSWSASLKFAVVYVHEAGTDIRGGGGTAVRPSLSDGAAATTGLSLCG
jgi:hypothetical protein